MDRLNWVDDADGVDLDELSNLYRLAPLGDKPPQYLKTVLANCMFVALLYADDQLVGVGCALADGADCAYISHVAVHPDYQGRGLGSQIVSRLVERARGHKKIILYANPGTEPFYRRLGFLSMNTAMAIWNDPESAIRKGLLASGS